MKKPNGIIQARISSVTANKVKERIFAEINEAMLEADIAETDTRAIVAAIVEKALTEMSHKATDMGGYSPEDQLYNKACKIMQLIDENEGLESLIE